LSDVVAVTSDDAMALIEAKAAEHLSCDSRL